MDIVNSFFANNGYSIVFPERISLYELVNLLHNCDSIAYVSGTLQHNMLFAPNCINTIAVERRIMLSLNQTDIT